MNTRIYGTNKQWGHCILNVSPTRCGACRDIRDGEIAKEVHTFNKGGSSDPAHAVVECSFVSNQFFRDADANFIGCPVT